MSGNRFAGRSRDHLPLRRSPGSGPEENRRAMNNVKRLAVYCGSAPGGKTVFADAARATAHAMVGRGVDLVYGGGRLGLMGMIADRGLELGGPWDGAIPA